MRWLALFAWLVSAAAFAGCEGRASWRYAVQPSLLAHDPSSALVVVVHQRGCLNIRFPPHDLRAGTASLQLAPLQQARLEGLLVESMTAPVAGAASSATSRVSTDPLLISLVRLRSAKNEGGQSRWVAAALPSGAAKASLPPRQALQRSMQALLDSALPP